MLTCGDVEAQAACVSREDVYVLLGDSPVFTEPHKQLNKRITCCGS